LDSKRYNRAFEIWVTKLRQDCLQRQKLAQAIRESDYSSWATPAAQEPGNKPQTYTQGKNRKPHKGNDFGMGLTQQVQVNWPTPQAFQERGPLKTEFKDGKFVSYHGKERYGANIVDAVKGVEKNWPTPTQGRADQQLSPSQAKRNSLNLAMTVEKEQSWLTPSTVQADRTPEGMKKRVEYRASVGRQYNEGTLREQVNNWPTVTVQDAENNAGPSQFDRNSQPLNTAVVSGQPDQDKSNTTGKNRGQLNPKWVSQLMGLPVGWTNVYSKGDISAENKITPCGKGMCLL